MPPKHSLSIGVAAAILLSSIACGPALVGAADPASVASLADSASVDASDSAFVGAVDPAAVADPARPSPPGPVAADANASAAKRDASAARQDASERMTPDAVVLDVRVHENGTATWVVSYRMHLDDAAAAAAFDDYAAAVENDSERYVGEFADRMTGTLRSAERFTDREMGATNYSVRTERRNFPQRYGVVAYSFQWQGFANVSGDRVRVGDALSGLVLDGKTKLCVEWPAGYEAAAIQSAPDTDAEREQSVVWSGPVEFPDDEPRVVLAVSGAGGPGETSRLLYDGTDVGSVPPSEFDAYLH